MRALSAPSFRQGDAGVGEGWKRALSALGWRVFPVEEEGVGVGEEKRCRQEGAQGFPLSCCSWGLLVGEEGVGVGEE